MLWLTGRIHPAARMRLSEITIAPSCSGEFLKKMFSISRWLMLASIMSPVSIISSSGESRSMTISAPTLPLLMLMQAITTGIMASMSARAFLSPDENRRRMPLTLRCVPRLYRNFRISSWNNMIIAITPTLTSLSMMLPSRRISSTWLTNNHVTMNTRMPMNTLSDRDSFMRW